MHNRVHFLPPSCQNLPKSDSLGVESKHFCAFLTIILKQFILEQKLAKYDCVPFGPQLTWSPSHLVPMDKWSQFILSPRTLGPQDNWSPWTNGPHHIWSQLTSGPQISTIIFSLLNAYTFVKNYIKEKICLSTWFNAKLKMIISLPGTKYV